MLQCVSDDTRASGQLENMSYRFTTALQHNECEIFTKKEEEKSEDFPHQKKSNHSYSQFSYNKIYEKSRKSFSQQCKIRGESQRNVHLHQARIRLLTLALKPRRDVK